MGKIRKLRPWARWFDTDVRAAQARHMATLQYQIVDYTDGGIAVKMPVEMVPQWEAMPAEVRAQFMADVDAKKAAGDGDASGYQDWRSS